MLITNTVGCNAKLSRILEFCNSLVSQINSNCHYDYHHIQLLVFFVIYGLIKVR